MAVNALFKCKEFNVAKVNESFSNCKITAIVALPQNGHKGRDANNYLKSGGMPKRSQMVGCGKCLL